MKSSKNLLKATVFSFAIFALTTELAQAATYKDTQQLIDRPSRPGMGSDGMPARGYGDMYYIISCDDDTQSTFYLRTDGSGADTPFPPRKLTRYNQGTFYQDTFYYLTNGKHIYEVQGSTVSAPNEGGLSTLTGAPPNNVDILRAIEQYQGNVGYAIGKSFCEAKDNRVAYSQLTRVESPPNTLYSVQCIDKKLHGTFDESEAKNFGKKVYSPNDINECYYLEQLPSQFTALQRIRYGQHHVVPRGCHEINSQLNNEYGKILKMFDEEVGQKFCKPSSD